MDFLVTQRYSVSGMHCAACAHSVESLLSSQAGVAKAEVHFATASARVEFNTAEANTQLFHELLQPFGFDLLPAQREWESERIEVERSYRASLYRRTLVAWLCALPIMVLSMMMSSSTITNLLQLFLCLLSLGYAGRDFFVHAYQSARIAKTSMDTLISLSTGLAFSWSVLVLVAHDWLMQQGLHAHLSFESASMVIAFVLLGKLLEESAKDQSRSAVDALKALQPQRAHVVREGVRLDLAIEELRMHDQVMVSAGESIAVDGIVIDGQSSCDESMLSGESRAVVKTIGSRVFAGTTNLHSVLLIDARSVGDNTMLAHIRESVLQAQETKVAAQRLVDFVSARFVPAVMLLSVISFGSWLVFGGTQQFGQALQSMIAVLVVACPCALGLAAPIAVVVGIGRAARLGILVRSAETLETSYLVHDIVFDKTGTLSQTHLDADTIVWLRENIEQQRVLSIIYSIESHSQHPVALAIQHGLENRVKTVHVERCQEVPSKGMIGYSSEHRYLIGSAFFVGSMLEQADALAFQQYSGVFVADHLGLICVLPMVEGVEEATRKLLGDLQRDGYTLHLLSGDQTTIVQALASSCSLTNWRAECTPESKEQYIQELQKKGRRVAMIGDGINDAPSLARADLSIAMGGGSDTALQASDVVFMRSQLRLLPTLLRLSVRTRQVIRQNLVWAFAYNVLLIPLAAGALQPFLGWQLDPMYAGAAMALSSISVVANSLRLKSMSLEL